MSDLIWLALGLVLVFEGLTYALVPGQMQRLMRHIIDQPPESLRMTGVGVLAAGVFVIWLAS